MGAWGPKLYQDDVAVDVSSSYKEKLKRGKTNEEATQEIIEEYSDFINDDDDGPIFWFALADTQWSLGRLLPEVKDEALRILESGGDIQRWIDDGELKGAEIRKKSLEELKNKLNEPQPPEKKISKYRIYKCEWKLGDVFAYRLESDLAKEKNLYGRYALLQKVNEGIWYPEHIVPIVRIRISDGTELPSLENVNKLEYVKIGRSAEGIYKYFLKIVTTSKRIIPKKLIYLGNTEIIPPPNEYIPASEYSYFNSKWSNVECWVVDSYYNLNLKNHPIFKNNDEQK